MRKINYKIIILLIVSIVCIVFTYNNYFLYNTSILKVTSVENISNEENLSAETYYTQNIMGILTNGKYKGKEFKATNSYSYSLVYGDKIENHTDVFVEVSDDGESIINITGVKRDKYIVILLIIFIDLLIIVAGKKGFKTLASLIINVVITAFAIMTYMNNNIDINMLVLYSVISILFIILSLFITNGKGKKTLAAIVSSIISLFLSFGLSYLLILLLGDKLNIWGMEYIDAVHDYYNFFYVSILLCGLGAIMDIAITISSSLNELIIKDSKIDKKTLFKSGKIISKDIVGTMINVMLFTCYSSVIPMVLLAVKNNMALMSALDFSGNLELTIVLCNCIGIVLTIPISLYVSVIILSKNKKVGMKNE